VPEFDRLELTIRRLLEAHDAMRRRLEAAEARVRELESALQEVSGGRIDPVTLAEEARSLEQRNALLEDRLARARESVERMMSRLQFTVEEQ